MGTQSYKNGYTDKLNFWRGQLVIVMEADADSIEKPRYSEERCIDSILYFQKKHEQWIYSQRS
jgi:hypothetical protein